MKGVDIEIGQSVPLTELRDANPKVIYIEFAWHPEKANPPNFIKRIIHGNKITPRMNYQFDFEAATIAFDGSSKKIGEASVGRIESKISGIDHFSGKIHQEFVRVDFNNLSGDIENLDILIFDEKSRIFDEHGYITCTVTNNCKRELLKYNVEISGRHLSARVASLQHAEGEWVFTALADA